MYKLAQNLERDITRAARIKLVRAANIKTANMLHQPDPRNMALMALLGGGAGALGVGALSNIMASPEAMYDNGITAGGLDLKPTPAYEGQEPVPWYRNPNGKELSTILGALAGLGGGALMGANIGAAM